MKKRAENAEMLAESLKKENAAYAYDLRMVETANSWAVRKWQKETGRKDVIPAGMEMVAWLLFERMRLLYAIENIRDLTLAGNTMDEEEIVYGVFKAAIREMVAPNE